MRRIWGKRGAGEMKGRKTLRRAGIVLGFGLLLCAGVMASGAFGMHLDGGTSTSDSTSTAADPTTTAPSDGGSTSTDTASTTTNTAGTTATDTTSSTTTTSPSRTPSISSDQADYAPGSTVTLTGSGWGSGERVHIFVNDDVGQTWQYNGDVTADPSGGFTTQFQLPNSFVATYKVTATGATGEVATVSFTDASVTVRAAPSGVTFTLTYQGFSDSACSAPVNGGNGTALQGPVTATTGPTLSNNPQYWKFTAGAASAPTGATFSSWSSSGGGSFTSLGANVICALGNPSGSTNYVYTATYTTVQSQTITVGTHAPASAVFNSSFTVAATASSSLPVSYTSTGACSNLGATFTMTSGAGTCTVHYNQAGNASFNPAPEVTESVTAQKADQAALSVTAPSLGTFGQTLQIVSSGGSGTGAVGYSVGLSSACALNAGDATKLDITAGTGSCAVTATKAGDGNYNPVTSAAHTVAVSKADQAALSVDSPNSGTFGDHLTMSASGGSTVGAITFAVTGDSGACSILTSGGDAGKLAITAGMGTCKITATRAGNGNYNDVTSAEHTVTVSKANQSVSFDSGTVPFSKTYHTTFTPTATATSGLTPTISVSGGCSRDDTTGVVLMTSGTTSCQLTASQGGNGNYNAATDATAEVLAVKADQATLMVTSPDSGTFGQTLQIASSGGNGSGAVTYSVGGSSGCAINGTDGTKLDIIHGSGTCAVTAHKATDADYNAADSAAHPVVLSRAGQAALSVTSPDEGTFGQTLNIFTDGGSGSGVISFDVGSSSGCAIDLGKLKITHGSGSCELMATKAGDGDYNPVSSAAHMVTLHKADQATLMVTSPDSGTFGQTLQIASSGGNGSGAVTYSVGGSSGCAINGTDGTKLDIIHGSGTCAVTAHKATDADYNAADSAAHPVVLSRAGQAALSVTSPNAGVFGQQYTIGTSGGSGAGALTFSASGTACAIVSGKVSITHGTGTCSVAAHKAADADYTAADSADHPVAVSKADQAALTVNSPDSGTYGDKLTPAATGGSGTGALSFTAAGTACAMGTGADAGKVLITQGTGTCSVTAHQAGDGDYNDADSSPHGVTVNRKTLTVTAPTLTILLGQPVPTLSPIYNNSQFVGSDSATSLNTQPTCATTTAVSGIGTYTTRCSGGSDNNYAFTYVDGTLRVNYNFHGFFQPVDNDIFNVAQAGSAIPVKFDLNGNQGMNIFAAGYPKVTLVTCPSASAPVDVIEEVVAATTSGLQYDGTTNPPIGQYIYVWKTDKAWANSCRQLEVKFADSVSKYVKVQFKK
jgi:MBG domain (YGX type)